MGVAKKGTQGEEQAQENDDDVREQKDEVVYRGISGFYVEVLDAEQ